MDNAGETPGTLAAATGCTAVCGALEVGLGENHGPNLLTI